MYIVAKTDLYKNNIKEIICVMNLKNLNATVAEDEMLTVYKLDACQEILENIALTATETPPSSPEETHDKRAADTNPEVPSNEP